MCCTPVASSPDIYIKERWIIQYGKHFSSMTPSHTTNFLAGPSFRCSCHHINVSCLRLTLTPPVAGFLYYKCRCLPINEINNAKGTIQGILITETASCVGVINMSVR
jgi:hypothetical protein